MKNILDIVPGNECCGCGGCVNSCSTNAIVYCKDQYGFIKPAVDESKCISCGRCINVCPIINVSVNETIDAYAGINRDKETLVCSSSGGIFFPIAKNVLKENGIVFACTMNSDFSVRHIRVSHIDELYRVMKSKYVQSDMNNVHLGVKKDLKSGHRVLFCGTPCQVASIKNFVGEKNSEHLTTIDIVCHGIPSQELFNAYISNLCQKKKKELQTYSFRYKKSTEQGMNWYAAYKFKGNKEIVRNWPEDSFNYLYMISAIYRESCYNCRYAQSNRSGDITLCDYWGWENYHSEFTYKDSVSAVLVNTENGIDVVNSLISEGKVFLVPTDIKNIIKGNGCLREPSKRHEDRDAILSMWKESGYAAVDEWFKKTHRKQRVKYFLMRHTPKKIVLMLKGMQTNGKSNFNN